MATPPPPPPKKPLLPPQAVSGIRDYKIPAGQTVVVVNEKNVVTMFKSVVADFRIFTQWTVNLYPDETTAQTAITTNKWIYNPPTTPSK